MADIVFNVAKGKVARYADLPDANDALLIVLLKNAGLEADSVLRDYANLATLLAATNDEADFTGYSRKTLASVVSTPNNTSDTMFTDAADPSSYTNTGGAAQQIGKALIVWDGDTTTGTDTNIVPLVALDCLVTFDIGVPTTLSFNANGFFSAT